MKFFDLAFYRIAEYYNRKEGGAYRISSILLLTLILSLNILSILFPWDYYKKLNIFPTKYHVLYVVMIPTFCLIFSRYYFFKSYDEIKDFNSFLTTEQKSKFDFFLVLYIILSFLICFSICIYIGETRPR